MSQIPIVIHGYGFSDNALSKISDTMLLKFIQEHKPDLFTTIKALVDNHVYTSITAALNSFCDDLAINEPCRFGILSNIMREETGITVVCHADHGECVLAFFETYPWNLNEKERKLTHDDFVKIFTDYMVKNFGIQLQPEYVSLEYYN